jgi:hypothetical protein
MLQNSDLYGRMRIDRADFASFWILWDGVRTTPWPIFRSELEKEMTATISLLKDTPRRG